LQREPLRKSATDRVALLTQLAYAKIAAFPQAKVISKTTTMPPPSPLSPLPRKLALQRNQAIRNHLLNMLSNRQIDTAILDVKKHLRFRDIEANRNTNSMTNHLPRQSDKWTREVYEPLGKLSSG